MLFTFLQGNSFLCKIIVCSKREAVLLPNVFLHVFSAVMLALLFVKAGRLKMLIWLKTNLYFPFLFFLSRLVFS